MTHIYLFVECTEFFWRLVGKPKQMGTWILKSSMYSQYQWLEVDLGKRTQVTAVATQGRYGSSDWLTAYLLMFSDTGHNWRQHRQEDSLGVITLTSYINASVALCVPVNQRIPLDSHRQQNGKLEAISLLAFPGNSNADTVVQYKLEQLVIARYLRLIPLDWNPTGRIGLRLEIYGCRYTSDVANFDGNSSLVYRLSVLPSRTDMEIISLKFKTLKNSGTLFNAEGRRDHSLTLVLEKGRLLLYHQQGVSSSSGGRLLFSLGSLLDDQHWHYVKLERLSTHLNLTVDKNTQHVHIPAELSHWDIQQLSLGAVQSHGLQKPILSNTNFHGCLENLLYNEFNLIDLAKQNNPQVTVVGNVTFSCAEPVSVAVTFTDSHSFLQLPGLTSWSSGFVSVGLQFRTWNKAGLLLTFNFLQQQGIVWLYLSEARLHLQIHKAGRVLLELSTGSGLSDGQWHSVEFNSRQDRLSITVDKDEGATVHTSLPLPLTDGQLFFGGCPVQEGSQECRNPFKVFQGCMRLLTLDIQLVDLIKVQQRLLGNYSHLQIDMCSIIDRLDVETVTEDSTNAAGISCLYYGCSWFLPTKVEFYQLFAEYSGSVPPVIVNMEADVLSHGAPSTVTAPTVVTEEPPATAVSNQSHATYEQTCEAYKHKGHTSGHYYIDVDGSGPIKPHLIYCNMTEDRAWMVIQHNNTELTRVHSSSERNQHSAHFDYTSQEEQLAAIISQSEHCEQELSYHCRKSRLLNTPEGAPFSWWVGGPGPGQVQTYWGGALPGSQQCACGLLDSCLDPDHYCNCDADYDQWANDSGLLTHKETLPVRSLVLGDIQRPGSEAAYRVGPLHCYGDKNFWNAAFFDKKTSYLHFPTFNGELNADISFLFKTTSSSGVFLENLGIKDFIRIELSSSFEVLFSFDVGNGPLEVRVVMSIPLNDNRWHRVRAERNVKEASLRVDEFPAATQEAPSDGHIHLQLNSQLFIGGTASRQKGFLGCIRSLQLNGVTLDLEERARITPGVRPGCPGHCSSYGSLCQNQGRCVERANGFSCDCGLSAFTGAFCHKEISADFKSTTSIAYILKEPYELSKDSSALPSSIYSDMTLREENISLSFSTNQSPALLLYINSFYREYLALLINKHDVTYIMFQIDQNAREDFNLTSDVEFNSIKSLILGRVHALSSISLTNGPGKNGETDILTERDRERVMGEKERQGEIAMYERGGESDELDGELARLASLGFTGCLSAVRFNSISPLKAALLLPDSPVIITGPLAQSSCGSSTSANPYAAETTHSLSDQPASVDPGQPLVNAIRSDSALIGGNINWNPSHQNSGNHNYKCLNRCYRSGDLPHCVCIGDYGKIHLQQKRDVSEPGSKGSTA
ncbi:hypothetical protein PAMP_024357 [Pampus punctatissimus]